MLSELLHIEQDYSVAEVTGYGKLAMLRQLESRRAGAEGDQGHQFAAGNSQELT
ncbi:MAG: hypothetical protein ACI84O_001008 [Myxococcota bacterium]|jgi:hypothetical protein